MSPSKFRRTCERERRSLIDNAPELIERFSPFEPAIQSAIGRVQAELRRGIWRVAKQIRSQENQCKVFRLSFEHHVALEPLPERTSLVCMSA